MIIASSGDDTYLHTSDNRVVSLAETISGSLSLTDFSYEAYNYISKFDNTNKGLAFDGQNLYIFGSTAATGYAAIVIFNVQYKYWSIYDGLRVRQIFAYSGKTYFVSDNTDQVFNLVRGQLYDALPRGIPYLINNSQRKKLILVIYLLPKRFVQCMYLMKI